MNNAAAANRNRWKRMVVWTLFAATGVAAIAYAMRPRPLLVDMDTARLGPMSVAVVEDGITRIRERYVISTPLAGRMQRLEFDVGDVVEEAMTLVRMVPTDPSLLDPRAVAQAEARVRAAERKVDSALAAVSKADASANQAEIDMSRARDLKKTNAISESEFEQTELNYQQLQQEAKQAGFALDIAQYELELEKAALLLTAPEQPEAQDTQPQDVVPNKPGQTMELAIKAPIKGRVLKIYQESSAVLQAGAPLVEIGDPADLEIVVDVLSRDAVRIGSGDEVRIENWGGARSLAGRVRLVEPSGFTKISALGVEEQRVNVIVDFSEPPESRASLGDNFRVDCRVIIWKSESVLTVPSSALFRVESKWFLFSVSDGKALRREVQIGRDNGEIAEVVAGLAADDIVILYPSDSLTDGSLVSQR